MNTLQGKAIRRLSEQAYVPMFLQNNIDGSVRVSVVRKLGTGRMLLTITDAGLVRMSHCQDRGRSNHGGDSSQSGTTGATNQPTPTGKASN